MCIICKKRENQALLFRYRLENGIISTTTKLGRSAYLCKLCVSLDQKKLDKAFKRAFSSRRIRSGKKNKGL